MATMKMMARHFPKVLSTKYFVAYFLFLLSFIPVVWIRSSNKVSFEFCFLLMAEYFPQVFGEPNTPLPLSEVTTIPSKASFDCCFLFRKWKIVKVVFCASLRSWILYNIPLGILPDNRLKITIQKSSCLFTWQFIFILNISWLKTDKRT